jgi:hypothetical protein
VCTRSVWNSGVLDKAAVPEGSATLRCRQPSRFCSPTISDRLPLTPPGAGHPMGFTFHCHLCGLENSRGPVVQLQTGQQEEDGGPKTDRELAAGWPRRGHTCPRSETQPDVDAHGFTGTDAPAHTFFLDLPPAASSPQPGCCCASGAVWASPPLPQYGRRPWRDPDDLSLSRKVGAILEART